MQCNDARQLMAGLLDGDPARSGLDSRLSPHLSSCEACDLEWEQLRRLESLLAREQLVEPPANFGSRVTAYVLHEARRVPPWQRHLLGILAIVTGVASMLSAFAGLAHGLSSQLGLQVGFALGAGLLRSMISFLGTLGAIVAGGGQSWLIYSAMAVVLATLWFAALVLPRTQPAPSRVRRP